MLSPEALYEVLLDPRLNTPSHTIKQITDFRQYHEELIWKNKGLNSAEVGRLRFWRWKAALPGSSR